MSPPFTHTTPLPPSCSLPELDPMATGGGVSVGEGCGWEEWGDRGRKNTAYSHRWRLGHGAVTDGSQTVLSKGFSTIQHYNCFVCFLSFVKCYHCTNKGSQPAIWREYYDWSYYTVLCFFSLSLFSIYIFTGRTNWTANIISFHFIVLELGS